MPPRPAIVLALACLAFPASALAQDGGGYTNWAGDAPPPDQTAPDQAPDPGQTPAPDPSEPYPSSGQTVDPTAGQTPAPVVLPAPGQRLKVKVRANGRVAVIRKGLPRPIRQIVNAANRI